MNGYAHTYLIITALSIPAIAVCESGYAIFRTMGNAKITMYISVLMNSVNIIGDAALIYGLHMGVRGAAIATLLSRTVGAVIVWILLLDNKRELYIRKSLRERLNKHHIKKILLIGIPNSIENGMFQLGKIAVLGIVSAFGTAAIAANSITQTIASIQAIPGSAIALGLTTVISRYVGKGDLQQARYYNRLLIILTYAALVVFDLAIYFSLPLILKCYRLPPETAQLTRQLVLCHTIGAIIIWPIAFDLPASMRAAGDVRFAMVISVLSMWIFRIGTAYLLADVLDFGVIGVWIAMVADWLFRAIVFFIRWLGGKWQTKKII